MHTPHNAAGDNPEQVTSDFFETLWERSWTYIRTVVNVAEEPMVILGPGLIVIATNKPFCEAFKVSVQDSEGKSIFELGNGQWNIPSLRLMLEDIATKNTHFKGFQVAHDFPSIGRKVIILNGRQIFTHHNAQGTDEPIILLAMDDVTEMMVVAESLANQTKQIEVKLTTRAQKMEEQIEQLQSELEALKKTE